MRPLQYSISADPDVVIVRGTGQVTLADIEDYLAATVDVGVRNHAKLILLGRSTLALSPAELDAMVDRLIVCAAGKQPGPEAMVAGNALNLDMCVVLKQRVGERPFSIFVDTHKAVEWLGIFDQRSVARTVPGGACDIADLSAPRA